MNEALDKSPFKFLDSFTEADRDIFFGRDREVDEVHAKVFQSKILLIYGASGTGKSSIVNCGLANKFLPSDWLQIPVRRGGNIMSSLAQQVNKFNLSTPFDNPSQETSPKALKAALSSVFLDHFKPIYLVFDQFEELFIFGSKDEWKAFTETMRFLLDSDLELRYIFIIRGEYLEFLAEFEEMIPGFFDNRVRIEKMTRAKARESIIGPCAQAGIEIEDGAADELLNKLSPGGGRVELTFLQVFLDKLYKQARERTPEGTPLKFTTREVERLGQMSDVLAEFVDEQLFKMDNTKLATAVLKSFVSLQGTKVPQTFAQVEESLHKRGNQLEGNDLSEIVQSLVSRRILKDQDDEGRYELRHDSLAQKIFEKISLQERERLEVEQFLKLSLHEYQKRGTYLSEDDLIYIAPHQRKLNLSTELQDFIELSRKRSNVQQRKRRNRAILSLVIILLAMASITGFLFSLQQKNRADALAAEAMAKSEEALKQKDLAEQERQKAMINEDKAEQQAQIAEQERRIAEEQGEIADKARTRAEQDREAAILASLRAELSKAEALKQSELVQTEKQRAEHLRRLGLSRELAIRSARLVDPDLKAQLASIAFTINEQESGYPYQSEIYQALRDALEFRKGADIFEIVEYSNTINAIKIADNQVVIAGDDGSVRKVSASEKPYVFVEPQNRSWHFVDHEKSARLLLCGNKQGDLRLLDHTTGLEKWAKEEFVPEIRDLGILGNDQLLILSAKSLSILNENGEQIKEMPFEQSITALAVSEDEVVYLLSKAGNVWRYHNDRLTKSKSFEGEDFTSLAVSYSGNSLAAGTESGMIYLLNDEGSMSELPGHRAAVSSLTFSRDNRSLVSGAYDRSARIWNLDNLNQSPISIEDLPNWVSAVQMDSADHVWIATYGGKVFRFPIVPQILQSMLCDDRVPPISVRNWQEYVATDINQFNPCDE